MVGGLPGTSGRGRNLSRAAPTPDTAGRRDRFTGTSPEPLGRPAGVSCERARTRPGPDRRGSAVARYAPLITLGTVVALAGGLLLVNNLNTTVGGPPVPTAGSAVAAPP